jgi:glycosyltransferase involved in cell wall biosynthesis
MRTACIMDSVSRANGGIFEAERRMQQMLSAKSGIDVRVVGLRDEHTDTDLAAWAPVVLRALPVKGPRAFGYAPEFADALLATDADLGYLVGLWKYPSLAAWRWSSRTAKPVMVAPHGMLESWALRNSQVKKKIVGWLFQDAQLRQAVCLRALCAAEAASLRAYGLRNPICVIPNGIDLPLAAPERESRHPRLPEGRKVLLYLGRLHPKKGLNALIAAWSRVRSGDWILAIAGWDQGGHETELKRQATELGIAWADGVSQAVEDTSLYFLGPQFGEAKESCYRSCDAFILPSLSEGLPMVVLEAWAYGKPVLMTSACNLPEGFRAKAALQIGASDEKIEAGLRNLFGLSRDEGETMGRKGRILVEERFDWRKVAGQMASAYEWMLGGGPRPDSLEVA